ncbi:MAG TPA: LuxR C-terminal-related transcriptional regulator [Gaiellaceae bacterium]|nr:LuxR C-terminal-related transcriptional regulator [Gaiellaceae bacterium]
MTAADSLERGRASYAQRAWSAAYEALSAADRTSPLEGDDLELLATSAYMLGREDDYVTLLERAHRAHLDAREPLRAARCAFWVGLALMLRAEIARGTGWFGRAERLLDRAGRECAERGYLLIPRILQHTAAGDGEGAYAAASEAAEIGERFGDRDLVALVVQEQGHALVRQGRVEEGLRLVDEVMVSVTAGELSPIVTGLVYCNTIAFCQGVFELRRAREWTDALAEWCDRQPDMVAHTGLCLVHRAEIMELQGAWPGALEEARRAAVRLSRGTANRRSAGYAYYRQGEVQRLQGELDAAEESYREALSRGCEPQPGLALLRLAQGNGAAASAAIRRVLGETTARLRRAALLPAVVEIMLAAGDVEAAESACRELEEISAVQQSELLQAVSGQARGAVALARGDPGAALVALRRAFDSWQRLEAPYESARVRVLLGLTCSALGDDDTAALELGAAREELSRLGAALDVARVDSLAGGAPGGDAHGLTPRELQVLRLVAAGVTNKAIAAELVVSDRTVDRHVSNIFTKLRVSSRAAATAYAYEHRLV